MSSNAFLTRKPCNMTAYKKFGKTMNKLTGTYQYYFQIGDHGTDADHPQWLDPDPVQYGPDPWLTTQNLTRMVAHRSNTVQQLYENRFFC